MIEEDPAVRQRLQEMISNQLSQILSEKNLLLHQKSELMQNRAEEASKSGLLTKGDEVSGEKNNLAFDSFDGSKDN